MDIVRMRASHVSQVAELEKACFSMPWSETSVAAELTNPLSLWLVAMDGDQVAGYVGSQSVMGEADMMNIAVAASHRRCGIAQMLLDSLIQKLSENAVFCLTLEVRASNTAAISLYEKNGFCLVGRRPGYYAKPKEDALIYRKEWEA